MAKFLAPLTISLNYLPTMASVVNLPTFAECNHSLVQSLHHLSDGELVSLFKRYPDQGRYFTAIFCRYNGIVYSLIRHSARSPVQADYLFALTWQHILHELAGIDIFKPEDSGDRPFSLQEWLINMTAFCINQVVLPEVEAIHYSLAKASPPFWCYLQQGMNQLPPLERLILIMAHTFRWSDTRIVAYLQAEGEHFSLEDIRLRLKAASQHLIEALPQDIRSLYLPQQAQVDPPDSADDWFEVPTWNGHSTPSLSGV